MQMQFKRNDRLEIEQRLTQLCIGDTVYVCKLDRLAARCATCWR